MARSRTITVEGGDLSITQAALAGDIRIKLTILWIIGFLLVSMILGFVACVIWKPDFAATYLTAVLPIVSGVVFGLVSFIVG